MRNVGFLRGERRSVGWMGWSGLRVRGSCLRGIILYERLRGFNLPRPNAVKVQKPCIDGVPCSRERRTDGERARRCTEVQKWLRTVVTGALQKLYHCTNTASTQLF